MKIVCDACQAKYSISDDKVQGKVFKIRCKKCSNIIVVRGGANAAEAAPAPAEKDTRVYDYGYEGGGGGGEAAGDDAVWHLVINQDQVGPLTVAEVEQKFAAGEVDAETFTWREGFADWLPLAQVDAFAALVAAGSTTTAGSSGADAVSSMFGGAAAGDELGTMKSDPGDLFAAASSGSSRAARDEDEGDLFGSKPSSSSSSAAASASANQKLKGERNENSVLFSLNNLAQLASDTPRAASSSSSSSSGGPSAGHATGASGGEGSGLIDIRSMANAYMGGSGGAAVGKPAAASSGIGSIDDLPVFGGGGFSEPAVIMPVAARSSANNKMLYLMIGAVGLLAVVAIVMVVLLLKGGDDKPAQVASATPTEDKDDKDEDADKDADKPDDKVAEAGSAETKEPEKAAEAETKEPEKAEAETKEPEKSSSSSKSSGSTSRSSGSTSKSSGSTSRSSGSTAKAEPKAEAPSSGSCDEVSCVLNNYEGSCCSKFKKSKSGGGSTGGGGSKSDLPDALDRGMISAGVSAVKARVTSCGNRSSAKGQVKVKVSVGSDGRVKNVSVTTTPDSALGACVAAAMQKASFAKTQKGGSFSYPFVF